MNMVNSSIHNWLNNSIPGMNSGTSGVGGADFASFLEGLSGKSGKTGGAGSGAGNSLMDYLSSRFPGVNFSEGSVGETPKDVEEYFGNEEGDNVAVDSAAAEAMASNPDLAAVLEDAIAAMEESAGTTEPAAEGGRVQRNIMVTSISIRFSVSQISGGTGETLSMNELKTAFSEFADKLKEMAQNFFGDVRSGGGEGNDIDILAEEPQSGEGEGENGNPFSHFFGAGFSFSMYFSASSGEWNSQKAGGSGDFSTLEKDVLSLDDFMDSFRRQGNFQNYMSASFSSALTYGGAAGSGAFTSLLNRSMDIFGMSPQGMWQQGAGFNFQFGGSGGGKSALSDLLAMLNSFANNTAVPEPAPVEAPAEAPVEAEAVA